MAFSWYRGTTSCAYGSIKLWLFCKLNCLFRCLIEVIESEERQTAFSDDLLAFFLVSAADADHDWHTHWGRLELVIGILGVFTILPRKAKLIL